LGNALEVAEVMRVLTGEVTQSPLIEVTVALGGVLLANAGLAPDVQAGGDRILADLRAGHVADRFGRMIAAQGGPVEFLSKWARFLPEANVIREVKSPAAGHVTAIDGEALGLAVVAMGGGRQVETDSIDPSVGLSGVVRLGAQVSAGDPLAVIHAAREDTARAAEAAVLRAITLGDAPPAMPPFIHDRID
jgi:thymidine phosphorylase